jgi:hypothetical protein
MAIEFNCPSCFQTVSVSEVVAGWQIKCPKCNQPVRVPAPAGQGEEFFQPVVETQTEDEPRPPPAYHQANFPDLADPSNPYRSPAATDQAAVPAARSRLGNRTGPSWEKDGRSPATFLRTFWTQYTDLTGFYQEMRREGGLGAPFAFAFVAGLLGAIGTAFYSWAEIMLEVASDALPEADVTLMLVLALVMNGLAFFMYVAHLFIGSAFIHVLLSLFGGANRGFETTYRVVNYAAGAASVLNLIPLLGIFSSGITWLILAANGLASAHETTTGRTVAAVLMPGVIWSGLWIVLYMGGMALILGLPN